MLYFSYIQNVPSQKQPKILSANYIPEYSVLLCYLLTLL